MMAGHPSLMHRGAKVNLLPPCSNAGLVRHHLLVGNHANDFAAGEERAHSWRCGDIISIRHDSCAQRGSHQIEFRHAVVAS